MLGRNWEPATAKIVAKHFKQSTETAGIYEYIADVTVRTGATFRTKLKQPPFMSHVVRLSEGDEVQALADVARQRAKFDRSDPQVNGKNRKSSKDSFGEALGQPPGTPPPES